MRIASVVTSVIAVLVLVGTPASAGSIDFGDLTSGEFVTNQYQASDGLTIRAETKAGGSKTATIFKSNPPNPDPADPDLHSPMIGGNLNTQYMGNMLIIAENTLDRDGDGFIDSPDDDAAGGSLFFEFDTAITSFGFWVADIDKAQGEVAGSYFASFSSGGTKVAEVNFSAFVDSTSPFYISSVEFPDDGDRTANDIGILTAKQLWTHARLDASLPEFTSFDEVEIRFHSSAGLPRVTFTIVPLPASAWAGLGFLGLLAGVRSIRRRRRVAV